MKEAIKVLRFSELWRSARHEKQGFRPIPGKMVNVCTKTDKTAKNISKIIDIPPPGE
jgi:hypothetical protein